MSDIDFQVVVPGEEPQNHAMVLAGELGYGGELTVGAMEDGIRSAMRRTIEECLEIGKRLLLLKAMTGHGEFQQRVDLLGIQPRMAQRFMSATQKFAKTNSKSLLLAAGTQTKMLELLVLDDDEIEVLSNGESIGDLNLDEIECMSVSELKQAIRDRDKKIDNHVKHYEQLEEKYKAADAELRVNLTKKPGVDAYSFRTLEVRQESAALEYGCRQHLDALLAMFEAVGSENAPNIAEQELRVHAIALAASVIYDRAESFYSRLVAELGREVMPIQPAGRYALDAEEKQRLAASVALLDDAFEDGESQRAHRRSAERGGPGRKLGSKNKTKNSEA